MKIHLMKILIIILPILLNLFSCVGNKNEDNNKEVEEVNNEQKTIIVNSTIKEKKQQPLIDLYKLKDELDTFAINVKKTKQSFKLHTDTVGEKSSDKELWAFNNGVFKLINTDSTELLIRHYLFIPKTKRILRLYFLELKYPSTKESKLFFKKLLAHKKYKADLTGGYYLNYGLTGTTDYVVRLGETILWFNVSCQYSKNDFNKLIEIFRKNIILSETTDVIKCYCQELCE